MVIIYRRRKLGKTSCREIAKLIPNSLVVRNDMAFRHQIINNASVAIRWGCTDVLPPIPTIQKAEAIHEVNDKLEFRRKLNEHNLCPKTYFNIGEVDEWPIVLRPRHHAQGRNIIIANEGDIDRIQQNWYASKIINKKREYRIFIVQGRVIAVAQKFPANEQAFAWNVARGGRFENVKWNEWPLRSVRIAIEAFNLSKLDFGGVDVIEDNDRSYVLEINSAPSLTSPYRQVCMAKALNYMIENASIRSHSLNNRIPLSIERGGYKKFIHPAISDFAIIGETE